MNQILVSEKLYITPELKKKKKLYKFNFITSIFLVIILCGYYVYAEYDRNESDKSEEILASIEVVEIPKEDTTIANSAIKLEDDVLVVFLGNSNDEEVNLTELIEANKKASSRLDTKEYYTKNGALYTTVAVVEIPKLNITYPVIYSNDTSEQTVEDLLKISVVKYWGPVANEPGNFCIVGHNYHNQRFFSKAATLENGDSIYITDTDNETLEYKVYANYVVEPDDLKCTSQLTNGETDITLITCTMTGKQRTIIKARAINADIAN